MCLGRMWRDRPSLAGSVGASRVVWADCAAEAVAETMELAALVQAVLMVAAE